MTIQIYCVQYLHVQYTMCTYIYSFQVPYVFFFLSNRMIEESMLCNHFHRKIVSLKVVYF